MQELVIVVFIISFLAMSFFIGITIARVKTAKTQAKKYGMKKQVTDPILYWVSYVSAFIIITIKIIIWVCFYDDFVHNLWLTDIIPSIALVIFTRTIGKSVIMRAEKRVYINHLMTETKDMHKFVKEEGKWVLHTSIGKYPVDLSNTSVFKISEITGAKVEKEIKKDE